MRQIMRNGDMLTDLRTGQSAFVLSDNYSRTLVTDQQGRMHQLMNNGSMTTDLTTGATYFEI